MKNDINHLLEPQYLLSLALQNIEERRDMEALCLLDKLLMLDENFGPANAYMGWLLSVAFGEIILAEAYLRKAHEKMPNNFFVIKHLINVLRQLNNNVEAIEIIEDAIKNKKIELPELYYELGIVKENEHKYDEALKAFGSAIKQSGEKTILNKIEEAYYRCKLKIKIIGEKEDINSIPNVV